MPHWLIKSAIHRALSLFPWSHKWNEWFQERVTKSLELGPGAFEARLDTCRRILEDALPLSPQCRDGFTALELGTGWYPTVPIGLYLCGAAEIWSFDIAPFLHRERLRVLLNYFCEYDRNGALQKFLPGVRAERVARLREALRDIDRETPEALLEKLNLHVLVRDAQTTGLAAKCIDLFFSHGVLEYIPPAALANILAEFKRLRREGAVMIHYIDLTDQYSKFDKGISPFNFLKFSRASWNLLQSPLTPMNRLRIADYRQLIAGGGFEITKESNTVAAPEALDQVRLAPEFRAYAKKDLLVINTWIVARPLSA